MTAWYPIFYSSQTLNRLWATKMQRSWRTLVAPGLNDVAPCIRVPPAQVPPLCRLATSPASANAVWLSPPLLHWNTRLSDGARSRCHPTRLNAPPLLECISLSYFLGPNQPYPKLKCVHDCFVSLWQVKMKWPFLAGHCYGKLLFQMRGWESWSAACFRLPNDAAEFLCLAV